MALKENEEAVYDFSNYDMHVYPVTMYPALRSHMRATPGREWREAMAAGTCAGTRQNGGTAAGEERFRTEMQYNLMATFLW